MSLRIATRGSALAKAQAGQVAKMLGGAELVEVSSDGEVGDKARFVRGVERALLDGVAEIGVHSAKDLPGELTEGLTLAAVPPREDPLDAWIGPGDSLEDVPEGARVGTASLRRRAQLLAARPDLDVLELHGNVDTRLRKLAEGEVDATLLAAAGLERLGRDDIGTPLSDLLPAPAQGAVGIEARADDDEMLGLLAVIDHKPTSLCVHAERALLAALGADCRSPVAALARIQAGQIDLRAEILTEDGSYYEPGEIIFPFQENGAPQALARILLDRAPPGLRALFTA